MCDAGGLAVLSAHEWAPGGNSHRPRAGSEPCGCKNLRVARSHTCTRQRSEGTSLCWHAHEAKCSLPARSSARSPIQSSLYSADWCSGTTSVVELGLKKPNH
eukprot:scaffold33904_cov157-Isochrysis_galbana.AAC.1